MDRSKVAVGPGTDRPYAGGWRRALAALIDNLVWFFALFQFPTGFVIGAVSEISDVTAAIVFFLFLTAWFNYFLFTEWKWGQTIGKNATGIEVRTVDGEPVKFGAASIRNILRLIDWLLIGPIMIGSTDRKQRLGDKLAKTVVVRRPPKALLAESARRGAVIAGAAAAAPAAEPDAETETPDPGAVGGGRGRLPDITWNVKDTVIGILVGLGLAIIVAPLLILPFDPDFDSTGALLAAQGLLGATLIGVAVRIASRRGKDSIRAAFERLGLRSFAPSALGWMLLAMLAYYIAAAIFASFVLEPEQEDIGGELGVGDDTLIVAILAVVLIAVVAPISEELFFRGFVFSGFRSRFSLWPAALLAGLVFGMVHAPTGITTVIPLAALGVALAWLYDKTGSLWPCVIAHMINNSLALALISADEGIALPL